MNCKEARQRLHERFEGHVDAPELDQHLTTCANCRTYAGTMQRLVGILGELREETESIESGRLETMWPTEVPNGRVGANRFTWWRIAAAIGITVGGVWIYGRMMIQRNETHPSATVVEMPAVDSKKPEEMSPNMLGLTLRGESAGRFIVSAQPPQAGVQVYVLYPTAKASPGQAPSG